MPSVLRTQPAAQNSSHAKLATKKFKTVLGFSAVFKDTDASRNTVGHSAHPYTRGSLDTARNYKDKRKARADRSSVTNLSFFQPAPIDITTTFDNADSPVLTSSKMKNTEISISQPSRRPPVRMDAQDGPWSVSVAETPHDARSFSLYIKTPTHNITLTRTVGEIMELHHKLSESHPGAKLPKLPIDESALPTPPVKRKSTFLNTLSRLASPSAGRSTRQSNFRSPSASMNIIPSTLPTPLTSPSVEGADPFLTSPTISDASATSDGSAGAAVSPGTNNNSTLTALAAYLTTISNEPTLHQARVWKRFVRVRTDDLESVRVERAIKRVRSDVAAHGSSKTSGTPVMPNENGVTTPVNTSDTESINGSINGDGDALSKHEKKSSGFREGGIQEEDEEDPNIELLDTETASTVEGLPNGRSSTPPRSTKPSRAAEEEYRRPEPLDRSSDAEADDDDDVNGPRTPIASDPPASRITRSQSADPDKSSRMSRVYASSPLGQEASSSQTGDESSISTKAGERSARKKRSTSSDPGKDSAKKKASRKVVIDDFEMMRVLGKGCAGKVLLVRHKSTTDLYALKAITKRHVLAHQELQHTLTEQAVLKRMAAESKDPFVVKLWWSFHDKENLFLVMDFHPGGDLATQLARWGRLGRDRARFYAAEIVEGVEGLHAAGVIYRDLKPENILIGADGHIVLTDFGLSKEFPRRPAAITAPPTPTGSRGTNGSDFYSSANGMTQPASPPWMKTENGQELTSGWPGQPVGQSDSTNTFCGTAEYLAPEVIQGSAYSYEVDWWSFGTMLYEMLTGITPFWANNHSEMYVRVLQDELQFPDDRAIDQDTKSLIRGLLQRNPALRMCEPRIKKHPYFSMIDWSHVYYKRYIPPYIPPIDPSNASDTQNFDDTFLDMEPVIDDGNENEQTDTDQEREQTDTDRTDGEESNTTPSQSRGSSIHARIDDSIDVFDGYSFKGRISVLIDDEEEEEEESGEEEDEEDLDIQQDVSQAEPEILLSAPADEVSVMADDGLHPVEEEVAEPRTPEARKPSLPPLVETTTIHETAIPPEVPVAGEAVSDDSAPVEVAKSVPRKSKDEETLVAPVAKETAETTKQPKVTVSTKPPMARPTNGRTTRTRREKSGVPALDRYLSDTIDEDVDVTEREDEDDDWDFVEAADGEDRNGAKGASLFARGVVDRYRLAVFRKASTPSQRSAPRSFSGMSKASDVESAEPTGSPSPPDKQRRGRTPGLNFRKNPRQFLRPKSPPPSSFSAKSESTAKSAGYSASTSTSATLSAASTSSSGGLLTPSLSTGSVLPPSLKSKESATSMGGQSFSSGSGVGDAGGTEHNDVKASPMSPMSPAEEPEKSKNKKLKKYKEGAEKMFSIFQSPRQQS